MESGPRKGCLAEPALTGALKTANRTAMSQRVFDAVQAAVIATMIAGLVGVVFLGPRGSGAIGVVPTIPNIMLATATVSGLVWLLAFPRSDHRPHVAKWAGAIIVALAMWLALIIRFIESVAVTADGSWSLSGLASVAASASFMALFAVLFFGIILLPIGAVAAHYLRRYQRERTAKISGRRQ